MSHTLVQIPGVISSRQAWRCWKCSECRGTRRHGISEAQFPTHDTVVPGGTEMVPADWGTQLSLTLNHVGGEARLPTSLRPSKEEKLLAWC